MTADSPRAARARLRTWLEGDIEGIENACLERDLDGTATGENSQEAEDVRRLLWEAIAGLDALDGGKVPAVFKRATHAGWYGEGTTIPMLKMKALGYVALLRGVLDPAAKGMRQYYTAEKAQTLVADAHRRSAETLRSWEKTFSQDKPDDLTLAKRVIRNRYFHQILHNWPNGTATLFRAIKQTGKEFYDTQEKAKELRAATIKKSQGEK
jgi:hypothetical protein